MPLLFCDNRLSFFDEVVAQREGGEFRDLEVLETERDADDGRAEDAASEAVANEVNPAHNDEPDDVNEGFEASAVGINDLFAHRPKEEFGDFEELEANRDEDDGDEADDTHDEVHDRRDQTTENEPKNIAKSFHRFPFFFCL